MTLLKGLNVLNVLSVLNMLSMPIIGPIVERGKKQMEERVLELEKVVVEEARRRRT